METMEQHTFRTFEKKYGCVAFILVVDLLIILFVLKHMYIIPPLHSNIHTMISIFSTNECMYYINRILLSQRLRSLAAEHAGSLIKSMDTHSTTDNTVQVFRKIFRNELEEDFRFIHAELSKTIKDLTMVQMMSRSNNKDVEGMQAKVDHVNHSIVNLSSHPLITHPYFAFYRLAL